MADLLCTSLLTQLALEMPGTVLWQDGELSDANTTHPSRSSPRTSATRDHYEAVHHRSVTISSPRSVRVATVLLDPSAGPRDDGFPDPLTGEFVPHAAITREYMTDLTRRCRQYFRSVFQVFLDRIDRGEDNAALFAEFEGFYDTKNLITDRLNRIASYFGKTYTGDGTQWHGLYIHRLLRPFNVMGDLRMVLKFPKDNRERFLTQARQGCITDNHSSIGRIIWDVCKSLEYASPTYNEKIGRSNFTVRFNDRITTPFDALDPLVTPFNWDILEEILEELT